MTDYTDNELKKLINDAVDKDKLSTLERRFDSHERYSTDLVEKIYTKLNSIEKTVASLQGEVINAESKMELCKSELKSAMHSEIQEAYIDKITYKAFVFTVSEDFKEIRIKDSKQLMKIVGIAQLINFAAIAVFYTIMAAQHVATVIPHP